MAPNLGGGADQREVRLLVLHAAIAVVQRTPGVQLGSNCVDRGGDPGAVAESAQGREEQCAVQLITADLEEIAAPLGRVQVRLDELPRLFARQLPAGRVASRDLPLIDELQKPIEADSASELRRSIVGALSELPQARVLTPPDPGQQISDVSQALADGRRKDVPVARVGCDRFEIRSPNPPS